MINRYVNGRTGPVLWVFMAVALYFGSSPLFGQLDPHRKSGLVRNGGFNARGGTLPHFTQKNIEGLRRNGWKCPDVADWPSSWGAYGNNGSVEFPRTDGMKGDGYARLGGGKDYFLCGYFDGLADEDAKNNFIYTVWARGKGVLKLHVISYGQTEDGQIRQLVKPDEVAVGRILKVDSERWIRYRHLMIRTPVLRSIQPWIQAEEGNIDLDEVDIVSSSPALDLLVAEEEKLYGAGALIENLEKVTADELFAERSKAFHDAVGEFNRIKGALPGKNLVESMDKELAAMEPYVASKGLSVIQAPYYNQMIAATRVLNRLAGKEPGEAAALKATEAGSPALAADYKPGVRKARENAVTITGIEPNKILYEEGETATVKCTIVNTAAAAMKGTLVATEYIDLDSVREVARGALAVEPGGTQVWTFTYDVGPETFGRAIEVQCLDDSGAELDRWQEYFQVAREWLRVQMHTASRYNNMSHHFASEPTDWGVQPTDVEEWIAGSSGYQINPAARRSQIKFHQIKGKKFTFYQNNSFGGIMGYEEMRKHPEYVLYDVNGQFAVDPVYGGYPNPMELASPLEAGPRRVVKKPYLDRKYTPWQHASANYAMDEAIEYGAKCIKDYAQQQGFDGIYIDGTIIAFRGFSYDGKVNLPSDRKEVAKLNARIQNLYHRVLKEENPYFGTWYNYSSLSMDYMRSAYGSDAFLGAGVGNDVSDEWIRAMQSAKNVTCLMEWQTTLHQGDSPDRRPQGCFDLLCGNRNYTVQKYGGNVIMGYLQGGPIEMLSWTKPPGPSKWCWPTANYFMGQITATQHHIVIAATMSPSLEPAFQFQTRYSSLLWAPDIKLLPDAEKIVTLKTPEELWWKPLVYRRETRDGYDLIVHLLRIPPTPLWDLNWVDEPEPLAGVTLAAGIGQGMIKAAYACRPYHFEEPQQVVEQTLKAEVIGGQATVEVPPFRYHTMVVIRVAKGSAGGNSNQ